jgi:16S rRNA (guanine1207-N2)-methyltransferase
VIDFAQLRRWPDVEAPELLAHDATDRLLLDTAEEALVTHAGGVTVIGDRYGALTLGAATLVRGATIRVHQDSRAGELALGANAARLTGEGAGDGGGDLAARWDHHGLDAGLVRDARVVLVQAPRGLDALDEIAELVALHAHPEVQLFVGGRLKHMTMAMNDVLGRHFGDVRAGLARQKSRVLTASRPRPSSSGTPSWPRSERHGDLVVVSHAAAFAGTAIDIGTRALLEVLPSAGVAERGTAVDLGCGTGVLGASWARAHPGWQVVATDQSWAAAASARMTAEANGLADRVQVLRDDAGSTLPTGGADVVLLNPPFHVGATVHVGIAHKLFEAAARLLRPGGEVWCVWNSPLGYRPALDRVVGPTRQVSRGPKFTVTVSTRR